MTAIPMHPYESQVLEFIEAFGVKHPDELSVKLIKEEVSEVIEAAAHLLKELCDLMYVVTSAELHEAVVPHDAYGPECIKALFEIFPNVIFDEAFTRVHQSNMSKLVDGKPLLREDGKVIKGPNYKPPYLLDLIA